MEASSLPESFLLGIGNPLLDISAHIDESLLTKYGLAPNDAIMAEEKHMPLYQELLDNYETQFIAGGSVQNTLRVAQWILKKPKVCTYVGCVGDDDYATILANEAIKDGVNLHYQVTTEAPTGRCAVLVTNMKRSLCANLAAAEKFTIDHLKTDESKKYIEAAKYVYFSGFFLVVSPESVMYLAEHVHTRGKRLLMNLSAAFVTQFYKPALEAVLPYVDILFGNELEAQAFAAAFNIKGNLQEIAVKMAEIPSKDPARKRTVVITHHAEPVILVQSGEVTLIPVPHLSNDKIVDTNGAGDAFTGGFLGQMLLGKPYEICVECGIYAARYIIQHSGCAFKGESHFKPSTSK